MNFNIKQALTFSAVIFFPITSLVSCDSGDTSPPSPTSTAPSEDTVLAGDNITYTTNDISTRPTLPSLLFTGNETTQNEILYTYNKTGDFTFTLTTGSTESADALRTAYATLISGAPPGGDNSLASTFRTLLSRPPTQGFQPNEMLQILTALRGVGPPNLQLILNQDGTGLIIPTNQIHTHLVTTSINNRNRGNIGGSYVLRSTGRSVNFRARVESDPQFERSEGILVMDPDGPNQLREIREIGTFNIDLINPPSSN